MGKTEIAAEYAHRMLVLSPESESLSSSSSSEGISKGHTPEKEEDEEGEIIEKYGSVFWIDATNRETAKSSMLRCLEIILYRFCRRGMVRGMVRGMGMSPPCQLVMRTVGMQSVYPFDLGFDSSSFESFSDDGDDGKSGSGSGSESGFGFSPADGEFESESGFGSGFGGGEHGEGGRTRGSGRSWSLVERSFYSWLAFREAPRWLLVLDNLGGSVPSPPPPPPPPLGDGGYGDGWLWSLVRAVVVNGDSARGSVLVTTRRDLVAPDVDADLPPATQWASFEVGRMGDDEAMELLRSTSGLCLPNGTDGKSSPVLRDCLSVSRGTLCSSLCKRF